MNYFLAISGFIRNPGAALIFERTVLTLFLLKEALTFPVFFQIKRHGQEADIHLHHHNHRCIFEANSLRPTELS